MKNQTHPFWLAALTLSFLLTSCVPSLNPLYTPETLVFREDLLGVWKEKPQDKESWNFTKADEKSYNVTIIEANGGEISKLEGRLVKLEDSLFLDLSPSDDGLKDKDLGAFYLASLIPGHLILKVKIGAKLELQTLDPDNLQKHLAASPNSLAHIFVQKDRLVITASTADLQKFVKKHANNSEFWSETSPYKKQD